MPHVYLLAPALQRKEKIGDGDCVTLIREFTPSLKNRHTSTWKQGDAVFGNRALKPGTAIATFVNGKYPSISTGNHAAFYLRHDGDRIFIIDQFKKSRWIESRPIRRRGQNKDGTFPYASDNADAFFVIE